MSETMERANRRPEETWQLEDIFPSQQAWEDTARAAEEKLNAFGGYQGRLGDPEVLRAALDDLYELERKVSALFTYARMRRDEDNRKTEYQGLVNRAQSLSVRLSTATSFFKPELLGLPGDYLKQVCGREDFAVYRVPLGELDRNRPHTLSAEMEKLVAMTGEMGAAPDNIYSMLTDADMKFPTISGEDGKPVELTHANYISLMMSRDRAVREAAFDALYSTYKSFSNTIPAIYDASVKTDVFYARAARFGSALEAGLFPDDVPVSVYENLIKSVHGHLDGLNRFLRRNGELIGVGGDMRMIDVYVPAVSGFDIALPYEQAYDLVVESLAPLGSDYQETLRRARRERWIDPYPNTGKSSGAYSWGTYDSHPYVLLNYQENLDNLLTIAHELGHAMHSYYSDGAQPYPTSGYSLFVAEVASTTNEILTLFSLMEKYPQREAQAFLTYQLLDGFRATVFRQTQFAEFEKISHEMAEKGEPLTAESLNRAYAELNARYYASIGQDELIAYEWMRIPHFYRAFYVYKYATGYSAAMALASAIRREGAPAVERYRKFLTLGGSLPPIEALRVAGVDMEKPESVEASLAEFERLVNRYLELTAPQGS